MSGVDGGGHGNTMSALRSAAGRAVLALTAGAAATR